MADVRGMYELGRSANTLADTFGNLPIYAPEGLKQTGIAAGLAKAQNELSHQNDLGWDDQAERQWQQEAASRDDFGTAEYANDRVKFLQSVGASPAVITKAQLDAQKAQYGSQTRDTAQSFVQKMVEDRFAQELGMGRMRDGGKAAEAELVKAGKTPAQAHAQVVADAMAAGKKEMQEKDIVVNVDHNTGNIMAMDKDGNVVPLHPDIAAAGYKMLGQPTPWNAAKDIQNEAMATDKMFGNAAFPGPATQTAAAAAGMTPAQALAMTKAAETAYHKAVDRQTSAAMKAYQSILDKQGTQEEAKAAYKHVMEMLQDGVDQAKADYEKVHRIGSNTPASQAAAAGPPPPTPPPEKYDPEKEAALARAQQEATPSATNIGAAAMTAQQSPQAVASRIAALVHNLHLDQQGLQTPEVQAFLNSIDPQTRAALTDLMQHISNVKSVGPLPMFNNPRGQ